MTKGKKWWVTTAIAAMAVAATLLVPYIGRSLTPPGVAASRLVPTRPEPFSPAAPQSELRRKLLEVIWASVTNKYERFGQLFRNSSMGDRFNFFDNEAYAALVSYKMRETGNQYVGTVTCVLLVKGRWELDGEIVRITRSDADVLAEYHTENGRTPDRSKVKLPCSALLNALKGSTSEFSVGKMGPDWVEVTSRATGKSERWTKSEFTL
jgi:hypothetical protein